MAKKIVGQKIVIKYSSCFKQVSVISHIKKGQIKLRTYLETDVVIYVVRYDISEITDQVEYLSIELVTE